MKIKINKKGIDSHDSFDKFKRVEKIQKKINKKKSQKKKNSTNNIDSKQKEDSTTKSVPSDSFESNSFVKKISLSDISDSSFYAKVVEVHKNYGFVSSQDLDGNINFNDIYIVTIPKKNLLSSRQERNFICVGDNVLCKKDFGSKINTGYDLPQARVINLEPRTNSFIRVDPFLSSRVHTLSSNIDQIIIVSSFLAPAIRWRLIDRYLVMAEYNNIDCTVVLNKKDLLLGAKKEDPLFYKDCMDKIEYYRSLGYRILLLEANASSKKLAKDSDFKTLRQILDGKISLLSGHSGVGKSSIVNLFDPQIIQPVEPDSDIFYKGRHTTSFASFIKIKSGYIIDTPGIRSFNIPKMDSITLSACFLDIQKYSAQCEYRECHHDSEPNCMVKKKVKEGLIPTWRYESFLSILNPKSREGRIGLKDL